MEYKKRLFLEYDFCTCKFGFVRKVALFMTMWPSLSQINLSTIYKYWLTVAQLTCSPCRSFTLPTPLAFPLACALYKFIGRHAVFARAHNLAETQYDLSGFHKTVHFLLKWNFVRSTCFTVNQALAQSFYFPRP